LSLKQNLMQVLCSLTPAISISANTRDNGVMKTAKTQKHVHLQRSQLPNCWSKDTKRDTQRLKFVALTFCAVYSNSRKFLVRPRILRQFGYIFVRFSSVELYALTQYLNWYVLTVL